MSLGDVLNNYSFIQLWRPDLFGLTVIVAVLYLLFTGTYRTHLPFPTVDVSWGRKISFFSALLLFYLLHGTPINILGYYYLFSAHMLQMALSYMVIAPLLIFGTPPWAWRALLRIQSIKRLFSIMTHPIVAVLIFNGLLALYHFPAVFNVVLYYHWLHAIYHSLLFTASIFLWWPIIAPLPGDHQLTFLRKFAYLLAGSMLITPVCALVIFAQKVIYDIYVDAPQIFAVLPTLDDQQLGGVIMKMVQEAAYMTALIIAFFKWVLNERSRSEIDPIEEKDLLFLNQDVGDRGRAKVLVQQPSTERGH